MAKLKIIHFIILFTNYIALSFNMIYILKNIIIYKKVRISFKSTDNMIIKLLRKTYIDISKYLNNKYFILKLINNKNETNSKKRVKLYSVDLFNRAFHIKWLEKRLEDKFIIEYNKDNPDYLIFNVFGRQHLNPKYKNAIKIAVLTENRIPDLNQVDYALGHAHINYLDRYFKYSIFLWSISKAINQKREEVLKSPIRKKFCAAVISKGFWKHFRTRFINELNKYKRVDMGGRFRNNIGGRVKNKINFLSSYKFSLAMENSNGDGYISEKIIQSYVAGTIPIYYGDYLIDEYINPKSFILIKGVKDIKPKIEYIKSIDNDNKKYKSILRENVIFDNNFNIKIDNELKLFFYNIFQQEKSRARRIDCKFNLS